MRLALVPLLLGVAARPAGATEPALAFHWEAPQDCSTREGVLSRAEKLLGRPLGAVDHEELAVSARVARAGATAWRLEVLERSSEGTQARSVQAATCDELVDAAALLLALSIDPSLASTRSTPASVDFPGDPAPVASAAPEAPRPPEPSAPAADAPKVNTAAQRDRSPQLRLGIAVSTWSGRLPERATGGFVHVALSHRSWLWQLDVRMFPQQRTHLAGSRAGGDVSLFGAGAAVGYLLDLEPMSVGPIGGLELDRMGGTGVGVQNPSSASLVLLGLHLGARYALAVSDDLGLLATAAATALVNRPRFVLDGIGPVHRPDRWGWRAALGVEWVGP